MSQRRSAVKRARAEQYVLLTLVFMAGSVIITRLYLQWTGYPQLGGGELHIAHLLWGGLLLYIAALLPLILVNEWALTWSAILNGIGIGLFIDEIGKFITRDNDYFYPPAAPIIYTFFLLSVLLFLLVRRERRASDRSELHRALELYQEVVDGALDAEEIARLRGYLIAVEKSSVPRLVELGALLAHYLDAHARELIAEQPGMFGRVQRAFSTMGKNFGRRRHRLLLVALTLLNAVGIIVGIALFVLIAVAPQQTYGDVVSLVITEGEVRSMADVPWLFVRLGVDLLVSVLLIVAFVLFFRHRDRKATRLVIFAVVFTLSTVTLLTFYLDQFGAISGALYQFFVLLVATTYMRWHLVEEEQRSPSAL